MSSHRLYFITTALILAFTLAACNLPSKAAPLPSKAAPTSTPIKGGGSATSLPVLPNGTETQKASAPGSGGCANTYFPLSSGATWSYASTGSISGDYAYTRTLSGLSNTGFTTIDAFSGGITRTATWRCDSGNLTSLTSGSSNALVSSSSMAMTIDSVNATGYIIPNAFTDGKTWSENISFNGTAVHGKDKETVVSEAKTDCASVGAESVKVPAGTFDTVKITCHSNQVATVNLNGRTGGPVTTIQDSTQWYAQGVGLVQTMSSGDAGSETIQLTSYSIP